MFTGLICGSKYVNSIYMNKNNIFVVLTLDYFGDSLSLPFVFLLRAPMIKRCFFLLYTAPCLRVACHGPMRVGKVCGMATVWHMKPDASATSSQSLPLHNPDPCQLHDQATMTSTCPATDAFQMADLNGAWQGPKKIYFQWIPRSFCRKHQETMVDRKRLYRIV